MCNVDITRIYEDYTLDYLKGKAKIIEIEDNLLEIGVRKGLIEKSGDMYYFIGDYEELMAFVSDKRQIPIK